MALRFLIGRAGSGKTRHCLEAIRRELRADPDGPPLLLLVPEQAAFLATRELLDGLPGYRRAEVVSFRRLTRMVFADLGPPAQPPLSESARLLVLRNLLARHRGRLDGFGAAADGPGFAAALAGSLTELAQYRQGPEELAARLEALRGSGAEHSALAAKLADLRLLSAEYRAFLSGRFTDPDEHLSLVAGRLADWGAAAGCRLWVDGFTGFTPQEYEVLARLLPVAERTEIALTLDPDDPVIDAPYADAPRPDGGVFDLTADAYRRLHRLGVAAGLRPTAYRLRRRPGVRFAGSPELAHLEAGFPAAEPRPFPDEPTDLVLVSAPDPRAEVRAAAAEITALVRDRGYHWSHAALVLRDLPGYADLVAEVFAERGIPHFVDRRTPVGRHPLTNLIRSALRAVAGDAWDTAAVMSFCKNDLAGLPRADVDRLEVAARALGLTGPTAWADPRPWPEAGGAIGGGFDPDAARRAATAALRNLRDRTVGGAGPPTVREIAAALWGMLEELGVPERLLAWADAAEAAGDPGTADRHRAVAALIRETLEQTVDALGATRQSLADFADALEPALASLTVGQIPPGLDGVLVGDVGRSRFPALRAVLILGAGEGLFPRAATEDTVLDDADRRRFAEAGGELAPTAERRLFDESHLVYTALTRASRRVWVSRPRRDLDGRPVGPGRMIARLRELFPRLRERVLAEGPAPPAAIDTPDALAAALGAADAAAPDPSPSAQGLLFPTVFTELREGAASAEAIARRMVLIAAADELQTDPAVGPLLGRMLAAAGPAVEPRLPQDLAARLFGPVLRTNVSRLERFAECPFRHFAAAVLRPAGPTAARGAASFDLVRFQRTAVERFLEAVLADPPDGPDAVRTAMDSAVMSALVETLPATGRGLGARRRFQLERARRRLHELAESLAPALPTERLTPAAARVGFGAPGDPLPALSLPLTGGGAAAVEITGRIARIDAADRGDGGAAVAVRDFRAAGRSVSLARLWYGLSLRPAVHLLVLQEHGARLPALGGPVSPAAAVSIPLSPEPPRLSHPPRDPPAPAAPAARQRGLLVEEFLSLLDAGTGTGPSPSYHFRLDRDRRLVDRNRSDVLTSAQMTGLLTHVRSLLAGLAERILGGEIAARPYRLGAAVPCRNCASRRFCRFDPETAGFRRLEELDRAAVLDRLGGFTPASSGPEPLSLP
jgi:ATP-dependent helicase/nuclease subunit B